MNGFRDSFGSTLLLAWEKYIQLLLEENVKK